LEHEESGSAWASDTRFHVNVGPVKVQGVEISWNEERIKKTWYVEKRSRVWWLEATLVVG